ncbi:MAG: hypothetical protein ACRDL8_11820, partial [Solirubrobacteraceae bacterium]
MGFEFVPWDYLWMGSSSSSASDYRVDELGWLQFERVCSGVLGAEAGLSDLRWLGHADTGRVALIEEPVVVAGQGMRLAGPVTVVVVWVRDDKSFMRRLAELVVRVSALPAELGSWFEDRVLLLTNLDGAAADRALQPMPFAEHRSLVVLGARELGASLDRHSDLRAAIPSVLGLRDLTPLIPPNVWARSSLDVERAQALARVFWPTRAYDRARVVLARHRFVVLTGPPEMGKTAIARMIALAQLTDGWEAHECTSPEQVWRAFDAGAAQVFVADDAFGSTEYRADAAERWARAIERLLRSLDDRHWLIWTSRPGPLHAALRRL